MHIGVNAQRKYSYTKTWIPDIAFSLKKKQSVLSDAVKPGLVSVLKSLGAKFLVSVHGYEEIEGRMGLYIDI